MHFYACGGSFFFSVLFFFLFFIFFFFVCVDYTKVWAYLQAFESPPSPFFFGLFFVSFSLCTSDSFQIHAHFSSLFFFCIIYFFPSLLLLRILQVQYTTGICVLNLQSLGLIECSALCSECHGVTASTSFPPWHTEAM